MKRIFTLLVPALISCAVSAQNTFWSLIPEASITAAGERVIVPDAYATYSLSVEQYKNYFAAAPMEFTLAAAANPLLVELPMPDKSMAKFKVWESPMMAPGLAAQLPGIKTYTGQGLDDPATIVKIDFTYRGFHAMVLSSNGTVFIDPYYKNSFDHYLSYYTKDFNPSGKPRNICKGLKNPHPPSAPNGVQAGNGTQLRTYRLAVACTGEYSVFFGGTLAATSSAITTTINRVNGVYEREVAVRLVLVANNNNIVFTNPATDPFDGNDDAFVLIDESQTVIDNIIGSANYDVGHTFSTGGGGLAGLGVVCFAGSKAYGITGSAVPVGDPYDIDYVAHELGHQFNSEHSFNGDEFSCDGNRNATTAYEVGSGSTIMSYAGICGSQDVQPNSDPFFHTISYDEIVAFTNTGGGNNCPVTTATGNGFPVVSTGTGGFTIPKNTPFTLTGSATDPNGDALTYCWDQFDLGSSGLNTATSISGPNFRSFSPVTTPTRSFPRINDVAANISNFREVLYNGGTDRTFNFRLTARDNRAAGGGVQYAALSFVVSGTAGPLSVAVPNTAVNWVGNSVQAVTWSVNSTNIAPVSCANVRILLSTDGGLTYPTTILASTPNDGTENITVPNVNTTTARIRVECVFSNYSFFDISNVNFAITQVIPVSLLSFTAQPANARVVAQWKTAQEINSSRFIVERSATGSGFAAIGSISAAGNTSTVKQYSFNDNDPFSGLNFYRLKIVDRDGTYKYSEVVSVKFNPVFDLHLSPNPAGNFVQIKGKSLPGNATVEIFTSGGQRVFSKQYNNVTTINEVVATGSYAPGVYRVKIISGENVMNKKLLIAH
jgi:Metallo-peptidase family M12B Reprolysin-like/Secretion system C-terminal sorting domain